jgi:TRAP-type C4-dicarboxylate transport system permease small subunit
MNDSKITKNLKQCDRFFRFINKVEDILAAITTVALLVVIIIQIIGRVIGRSVPWTEEGTRFIFIWMIFLGIGMGFRKAESARVTMFLKWMPRIIQKISIWVYVVSTVGFFVFMFFTGIQLVLQQYRMHEIGSALMIPMWLVGICVPISSIIGIIGVIESLIIHPEVLKE